MATLYLMLGYPGAGKTTTAELIAQLSGAIHLSSDKLRLEMFPRPTFSSEEHQQLYDELDNKTEQLLSEGKSVIYDANLNRYQHRKGKYDICDKTGAKPVLVWVQTSQDVAKNRAVHESRKHLWNNQESPGDMFDRIASILEEPKDNEPYVALDGTKISLDYVRQALQL